MPRGTPEEEARWRAERIVGGAIALAVDIFKIAVVLAAAFVVWHFLRKYW